MAAAVAAGCLTRFQCRQKALGESFRRGGEKFGLHRGDGVFADQHIALGAAVLDGRIAARGQGRRGGIQGTDVVGVVANWAWANHYQ